MTTATPESASTAPVLPAEAVPPTTGNIDPATLPFFAEDFAYVDTETTGVDAEVDRIVEIAIVRFRAGVREEFHTLVDPQMHIPATASAVHHITDATIAAAKARGEAPTFPEIADKVAEMLDGAHVYAHNAPFDEGFVDGELEVPLDPKSWTCTVRLSRHLVPEAPAHGNQVLRYWFRTNPASAGLGPHRAIDDVYVSLENTFHLWTAAAARGLTTQAELLALSNEVIVIDAMAFGKHVGKAFRDIPSDYFEWCLGPEGMKDMDDDLRISMERELVRPGRKDDDARIRAEERSRVVPATVMTFGQKHNGKPMDKVPLDYLEWIERDKPRCSAEVRAGVELELNRRREASGTAAPQVNQAPGMAGALARLKSLVRKGSEEERMLLDAEGSEERFVAYLRDFAKHEPAEFQRVSQVVGGDAGEWMRAAVGVTQAPRASAPAAAPAPAPTPQPQGPGRVSLFANRQADPEDDPGPQPEFELEGSGAPFAPAPAPRRMRPR
jgi:DNA polymerase III epsilon subunit-like protein